MSDIFPEANETKEEGEQPLRFYYNREHRLENAPQIVKDYYNGKMQPVKGFRALFSKQNKYIFIALVVFVGFAWAYSGINRSRNSAKIDNVCFEQQSFSYDGEVFVNIKVFTSEKKELKEPKKVNAKISFVNLDNQILEQKEISLLFLGKEDYLRTKMTDYDIIRVDTLLNIGDEEKEITSSVIR